MIKKHKLVYALGIAIILLGVVYLIISSHKLSEFIGGNKEKPVLKIAAVGFYNPQDAYDLFFVKDYLSKHYDIRYVEEGYDLLLTGSLTKKDKQITGDPHVIKIHQTGEVFIGNPRDFLDTHDLIIGFDYIEDAPNYIRVPLSYFMHDGKLTHGYKSKWRKKCDPSSKKYFACFLVSNGGYWDEAFDGARERNLIFHRLSLYKFVASGGKFLNTIQKVLPRDIDNEGWLSNCKFTIAYENQYYPGYITEKVYQAYFAGTIPIYNAHPSVFNELNRKAMVLDDDFSSHEEMIEYIKELDQDDKKYCKVWNQPIMSKEAKEHGEVKYEIEKRLEKILKEKFHPILKEREAKDKSQV